MLILLVCLYCVVMADEYYVCMPCYTASFDIQMPHECDPD